MAEEEPNPNRYMAGLHVSSTTCRFFRGLVLYSFEAHGGFVCPFFYGWRLRGILPPRPGGGVPINQREGDAHGPPGSARSGPARSPWFSRCPESAGD